MKIFILVTGILELLVGSILLINPKLMQAIKALVIHLSHQQECTGAAAVSIAVFALWLS